MTPSEDLETKVRAACEAREYGRAATFVVEGYGADIMAFLLARVGSRSGAAEEVFAMFAEKLWLGLPSFEWRCSMRSWAYRLARNAAHDFTTAAGNRADRNLPLSQYAPPSELAERVRTTTAAFRRTANRDRIRALRDELPVDDQILLVLRVDRGLDFNELAAALSDDELPLEPEALEREAARLRKRFERVKDRLRELAESRGLL